MIVKIHRTPDRRKIVAVCDSEIAGKKFEKGGLQLDASADFYKGEEMDEDELAKHIVDAAIVNMLGDRAVAFGLKHRLISEKNVVRIKGVPNAQSAQY